MPTEVRCPECRETIDIDEQAEFFICPACNADLDITVISDGVTLVSGRKDRKGEVKTQILDDPFLEDYLKWQMIAVFAMLAGMAGLAMAGIYSVNEFSRNGLYYLGRASSIAVLSAIIMISLAGIVGGALLYRYVRKEVARYEEMQKCEKECTKG